MGFIEEAFAADQPCQGIRDCLLKTAQNATLLTNLTVIDIVGNIIQLILGLVGVIYLLLMIYAGYNWMTAMGEEEKVKTAKSTLINSTIGLIIIFASYTVTYFVVKGLKTGVWGF